MTQSNTRLTAMTAIAAVLAFATPAVAQDAQPAPATTAPDPLGAPPPTVEPAPSTEPAPSMTTTVDPLSATTAVEAPLVATPGPATRARTTPRRATTDASAPARRVTPTRPDARTTADLLPSATSTALVEAVETAAPLATAPIVAARPPSAALPSPVEAPSADGASSDVLPIAAAGGLGLLALLGTGIALRRRKRRDEEAEYEAFEEPMYEELKAPVAFAEPMREPSMTRAPIMAAPVAPAASASQSIDAPATTLPSGFDLSRFGPHVQAAYRGPSEDNPSLSLKNRLRRASAMDQTARGNDEPMQPAPPRPLTAATSTRDSGAVVSKMGPASSTGAFILGGDATRPAMRRVTQP